MGFPTVFIFALVGVFQFFAQATVFTAFEIPPATVSSLNASTYLGRWYQMYTSLIPTTTFEKDAYCVTADYYDPSITSEKITFKITNSETRVKQKSNPA
jgi:lipocalin